MKVVTVKDALLHLGQLPNESKLGLNVISKNGKVFDDLTGLDAVEATTIREKIDANGGMDLEQLIGRTR